jgi:uncharacterized protein DUF1592/uncharacterized protein DUF1588/uncharacterized protein DUF1587/uncharacterized protein DUF1585/uncharacterized protein DUF1595/cytochrome c
MVLPRRFKFGLGWLIAALTLAAIGFDAGCLTHPSPPATGRAVPPPAPVYTAAEKLALPRANDEFSRVILPFVSDNCYDCHGDGKSKGGLTLDGELRADALWQHPVVWEKVLTRLGADEMPPRDGPKPDPAEKNTTLLAIDDILRALGDPGHPNGRMTLRRLNRAEYVNTVRDLLRLPSFTGGEDFPKDENGYGFDNIADLLTVSPLLFEQYLKTADQAVDQLRKHPAAVRALLVNGYPKETFYNKAAYAHQVLAALLPRAYRRPVSPAEIDRVYKFVALSFAQNGEEAKNGLELALRAILVDPNFLFRVELGGGTLADGFPAVPPDYQLANRLSYFLWSSMPDDELFALAAANRLHEPEVLRAQVRRLLQDPRAAALAQNFAGQWLLLRNLDQAAPDAKMFPQFNAELRAAMRRETELFFATVVAEDRSILDFIDGDFTFVNGPLAELYGIPGISGPEFQRVTLSGTQRSGILTQASILTVTSNPTRTSPVQRGKWILDNILNRPPPSPPDNVPALDDTHRQLTGTMRQKLAQHRTDPNCASCHQAMDPLGLALENYDPIGAWRATDGGVPIDVSATMPDGQTFRGAEGLKAILRARQGDFRRGLVEKMLIYALGRGLDYRDTLAVSRISAEVARNQDRFSGLILAIVTSDLFRGPPQNPPPPDPAPTLANRSATPGHPTPLETRS